MRKGFIIRTQDMDQMYNIVRGTCKGIVYRRNGLQTSVILNGIGIKDFLKVRKPLKHMALYW